MDTPSNSSSMPYAIAVEEYRRLVTLISDIEKQIVHIASGAVVVSVTILTAAFGFLVSNNASSSPPVGAAYVALAPFFVLIPAFSMVVAHRNELCRAASYLRVFYEDGLNRLGWDGRISLFRCHRCGQEAHGPIPLIFCAIAALTTLAFWWVLWNTQARCYIHYLVPVVPWAFLLYFYCRYRRLLSTDYESYLDIWRRQVHA